MESFDLMLNLHREALQNVAKWCPPFRDCDEFSTNLHVNAGNVFSDTSITSSSSITLNRHNIYTIEELTENSTLSIRKSQPETSSSTELKQRLEQIKKISSLARNAKRPVTRRGTETRLSLTTLSVRGNYFDNIVERFDLMDRFLNDQQEIKQDSSDESTRLHCTQSKSASNKNCLVRRFCCYCISE
ncbi:uncharacterized protein LOC131425109 [Malaya genurostris]|uniref:uncharacterized protein LOC131425109 n=1 Tax=Malaya genurostris TaxID=325434 RepID=UPI0026F3A990|nr:uncharacterized protein LOC131425109 [Malaya genurostris]